MRGFSGDGLSDGVYAQEDSCLCGMDGKAVGPAGFHRDGGVGSTAGDGGGNAGAVLPYPSVCVRDGAFRYICP